jgi:hypothetical protein
MPPSPLRPSVTARGTRRGSYRGNWDTPTGGARAAPPGCGSTVGCSLSLLLALTRFPLPSTPQRRRWPRWARPPTCTPGSGRRRPGGGASPVAALAGVGAQGVGQPYYLPKGLQCGAEQGQGAGAAAREAGAQREELSRFAERADDVARAGQLSRRNPHRRLLCRSSTVCRRNALLRLRPP